MTSLNQVYKCYKCGNIIEILHEGAGELVCCGEPMYLLEENMVDADHEKHVPVIEKIENGYKVKIGATLHPMEEMHYIEWIQLTADGKAYRKRLRPGDLPESEFCVQADRVSARAYCNVHGLWKA